MDRKKMMTNHRRSVSIDIESENKRKKSRQKKEKVTIEWSGATNSGHRL